TCRRRAATVRTSSGVGLKAASFCGQEPVRQTGPRFGRPARLYGDGVALMAREDGSSPDGPTVAPRLWTTGPLALTPITWRVSREAPATSESRPMRKETAMNQPRVIVVGN